MPSSDLRKMSPSELGARAIELREEVGRMTLRRNARRLEKPSDLLKARRELARVLTILGERSRAAASGEGTKK